MTPAGSAAIPPRRVTMPCRYGDIGLAGFTGRVLFRRRFGYPGRIDPEERVWLTFAGGEGSAEVRLNQESLGGHESGPFEFDVTSRLKQRNLLEVTLESAAGAGICGEVALEIRKEPRTS